MSRRSLLRLSLLFALIAGVSACDGQQLPAVADVSFADFGPLPGVNDVAQNMVPVDGGSELAGFQEPCQSNGDCLSGWCVPFEDYSVCTETCLRRESCPDGWDCRIIDNTPPDVISACLPPINRLCGVCERDVDCPNGHCFRLDGESICGMDCEEQEDCPNEFTCEDVDGQSTCLPITRSCSCNRSQEGSVRICELTNEHGSCIGRETCDAAAGWQGCTATEPAPETCNRVDDDCNGFTDDILGLGEVCEREADVEGATISCSGRLVCTAESSDPICTASAPMAELCNFLDDDCDGETDEGFEGRGDICVVGLGICERVGVNECSDDGAMFQCSVAPGEPSVELCDGLDNDCDGQVDETFPTLNDLCFAGEGACRGAGATRCAPDGMSAVCDATPRDPSPEACNGLDDDCDGQADEGFMGLLEQCSAGVGACRRIGFQECSDDGEQVVCSAAPVEPSPELCNGADDDCDGQTDEDFNDVNQACSVGVGACRALGVTTCSAEADAVVCNAQEGDPVEELCNGVDDDCDGSADEEFPEVDEPCTVGIGSCRNLGVQQCSESGEGVECSASEGVPQMETCNGVDDDCDGLSDESFADVNSPCRVGVGACERSGVQICSDDGASVRCTAVAAEPAAEVCNSLDDDCDGQVDEAFANVGAPCEVGVGACSRRGVTACAADGQGTACNVNPGEAAQDICNGVDDDCDGRTDEDFVDIGDLCGVGVGACERTGVRVCAPDGSMTVCSQQPGAPAEEICNSFDDDCDGVSDETHPLVGTICASGEGLCRRSGVFVCGDDPNGPARCDAVAAEPGAETCDYQDDDCDGSTDEGFADDQGRYLTTAHCGACGSNCAVLWAPDPAGFGVIPRCELRGGVAQCAFDCLPGSFDADGLATNGCELVPDPEAIYVTTPENGGEDALECGDFERPCATVGFGLQRAVASERVRVRVAEGVYREAITLSNGVELLGGHQRTTWDRDGRLFPTVLTGAAAIDEHFATVVARDIDRPTVFDGFVIRGQSPLFDGNAYGLHVTDAGPELSITNNRIEAGNGGRGSDGSAGESGAAGAPGQIGRVGFTEVRPPNCNAAIRNQGGQGGARVCDGINASGGQGGGARCPRQERREGDGSAGASPGVGGAGGDGAWSFLALENFACIVSEGGPADASPGDDGRAGSDGRGGDGAQGGFNAAGAPGDHWRGLSGQGGTPGGAGGGGGGGGAAAGVDVAWAAFSDVGSSGGGGGSGGCQGAGARGGHFGGGSFGIYVYFSGVGPRGADQFPDISDNEITRGLGGRGGAGGNGGGGGEGGPGGNGGPRSRAFTMSFCAFQGGEGGAGGRGGHGGGGGGGAGGVSYDIFVANTNGNNPGYQAGNVFTRPANEETHGLGGDGGNSSNTELGEGGDGRPGSSGQVQLQP